MFQGKLTLNRRLRPAIRNSVLLFVATFLFHVAGTWTLPLIDRDEPRFAEASREMLERGDYVVPHLNNRYRFDKPPLIYWLQSASYRVFGDNAFAARLPSVIAASGIALLLLGWGRRVGGERVGIWAAVIFAVCLQTFIHARAAVADMWLVLMMTAAHWAAYELLRDRLQPERAPAEPDARVRWWWTFYLALAFGFLAKGPIGWTPLLTVACSALFLRDAHLARRFLFGTGLLLVLALVAVWGIPALVRTDGEFFRVGIGRHVVGRSFGSMEGHGAESIVTYIGTLPFYFVLIFVTFLPWSIKLPWLSRRLWRERDLLDNFLLAGALIIFVIFTLVTTKLPHYTLPAYPLLALLMAKAFPGLPGAARLVRQFTMVAVCVGFIVILLTPFAANFFVSHQIAVKARADLTPAMEFGAVGYREPSLVWSFRKYIRGWMSPLDADEVHQYMEQPGPRFVVLPAATASALYPELPAEWKMHAADGFNVATGKRVDLRLLLKPE